MAKKRSRYLSVADVATLLSVDVATVRDWIHRGRLRGVWAGALLRVKQDDLERFLVPATREVSDD